MKNKFKKIFFGIIYPADIPEKIEFPSCWIWNTDTQNENGKHWVAIWLTEKNCIFFTVLLNQFFFIHVNMGKV